MNFNISSLFTLAAFVSFYSSSVSSAVSEPYESVLLFENEYKAKYPLYSLVHDANPEDSYRTSQLISEQNKKKNITFSPNNELDKFPHMRSALHRAIETMNDELVTKLINRGAYIMYGYTKDEDNGDVFTLLPTKLRGTQPPHLVGHIEEYYRAEDKAKVSKIMTLLFTNGINPNDWPAKSIDFIKMREEWAKSIGIKDATFAIDDSSSLASDEDGVESDTSSENGENSNDADRTEIEKAL